MTIGPALSIGGNTAEMTTKGRVQITNAQGKVKTLSQDQFKKQLVKNADKIQRGEDFEFKKDNKTALIAGGAVATAAIATGVVYRKDISKYVKDFSLKKLGKDIKGLFSSAKEKISGLFGKNKLQEKRYAKYSNLQAQNDTHLDFAKQLDASLKKGSEDRKFRAQMVRDARAAFAQEH